MSEVYFVSGIDTDAGKTFVTGYFAKQLMKEGKKVATLKFIQTGCEGFSEDILKHREIMRVSLPEDEELVTAPIIFKYPASAQLAAGLEKKDIDLTLVDRGIDILKEKYDVVLIEGAGGLMVPITDFFLSIDYVKSRKYPVILVTNGILGSINHTLLSLEAINKREIKLYAVAYNHHFDTDPVISKDTEGFIKRYVDRTFPGTKWIDVPSIKV